MCGGAIIYDYIPARRQASAADFWPDANDDYAAHDAGPDKGKYAQHFLCQSISFVLPRLRA
jgi:hypothetical protein